MRDRLAALYEDNPMAVHLFTARFNKYGRNIAGSNTALFVQVRIDGHFAADHTWIHRSKVMKRLELESGDIVEFEAQIERYARTVAFYSIDEIDWEYGLEHIRNLKVIERRKGQSNGSDNQ